MHPAESQTVFNVSGKEMFVVHKICHLAGCCQRGFWYRAFNRGQLHPSNPCRLKSVPQSCSVLMHLWTFLKGEKLMMCSCALTTCLSSSLPLPSSIKPHRPWAFWNRTAWVHLPTCVRGTQSSSSWMLHRPKTSLLCACTNLRMLVWPTHFWFPVTGQKHFGLCVMNIAVMKRSAALDYIPSGQKMRCGSSWWLEEHLSVPIYLLIFML